MVCSLIYAIIGAGQRVLYIRKVSSMIRYFYKQRRKFVLNSKEGSSRGLGFDPLQRHAKTVAIVFQCQY